MTPFSLRLVAVGLAAALAAPAAADEPVPFGGPLADRPALTGDWLGRRTALRDHGLTLDVSTTQYGQGVASGGLDRQLAAGGRNDYFLTLDSNKLGLWNGLSAVLHGESRYGLSANLQTGALSPVNMGLQVPQPAGAVTALTGVTVSQAVSENAVVYLGKLNTIDEVYQPLTGAGPHQGFWNPALAFNTLLAFSVPYSTFGAGFDYLADGRPVLTVAVYDTHDTPTTSGFDTFFTDGAAVELIVDVPTHFLGRPGHQGLTATYANGRYTSLRKTVYLDPLDGLVARAPRQTGTWSLAYHFDQAVWVSAADPEKVWGVFGHLDLTDGNPNPVRWLAAAGVGGFSPLPGRGRDTFGVGYFYLGVSGDLKRSATPVTPLGDEWGVELYYAAAVTPWCHLTPDVQVVGPFQRRAEAALVLGLRARIDF